MQIKKVLITSIPRSVFDDVSSLLANYTVGFVKLVDRPTYHDALLAGSGTLVQIGDTYGILTAHHVVTEIPSKGDMGLILTSDLHRYTVRVEHVKVLPLARGSNDSSGPDLGIVVLPAHAISTIGARKSFYNIETRREKLVKGQPDIQEGIWVLMGFIDQRTRKESGEKGYSGVRGFYCFGSFGGVDPPYSLGLYDYYDFRVTHGVGSTVPEDFRGVSGGGLWQVILKGSDNGKYEAIDFILSGVAFFQTLPKSNESIIRCHGRDSVYKRLLGLLSSNS